MKKIFAIVLIGFGMIPAIGQSTKARDYYDVTFGLVNYATVYYNKVITSENRIEANLYIDSLADLTDRQLKIITPLKAFEKNSTLRSYCLDYLKHLNKISKKELVQLAMFAYNTSFTEKDRKTYDQLRLKIIDPTLQLHAKAKGESEQFRTKYVWQYPHEYNLDFEEKVSFDTAIAYNDYIVDRIDAIDECWTLAIDDESMKYGLKWSSRLEIAADNAIRSLEKLKNFDTDFGFRIAAIEYAKHMRSIAQNELPEFIRIIRADEMTVEGEQRAEALIPTLDDTRERLFDNIEIYQDKFADTANFRIAGKEVELKYNYTEISTFEDAAGYNDYVVNIIDIIDHYWTLSIEEENMEKALSFSDSLNFYSLKAISTLGKLGSFKGYDLFRTAGIDYATHMRNISADQLKEFLKIIRAGKMNAKQEKRAESLIPILDDERERLFDLVEKAQNEYATMFDIIIVK